jgi:hypothetical protein
MAETTAKSVHKTNHTVVVDYRPTGVSAGWLTLDKERYHDYNRPI